MGVTQSQQLIYVNSKQKLDGTHSDFSYEVAVHKGFKKISVVRAQVPKSYYTIVSGKNTFTLTHNSVEYTITVTPARYTARSFRTHIETLLNAAVTGDPFTVSFPNSGTQAQTGKYTFTSSSGDNTTFTFTTGVAEQLGFAENSTTDTFTSGTDLVSTNVINLGGETTLFIHSDICSNNGADTILADIYANAGTDSYSNIVYVNNTPWLDAKDLNVMSGSGSFRFRLADESGNTIDLNGQNMLITLILFTPHSWWEMLKTMASLLVPPAPAFAPAPVPVQPLDSQTKKRKSNPVIQQLEDETAFAPESLI